ncbi:PAS domain-containing sensor histidine kinase [Kiloniella antarctica]|uniref:histidine kinase n=1 Tax=Kiloniella antarctica TaxID=1550907 RepID=A0ABW5BMY7_9PROT
MAKETKGRIVKLQKDLDQKKKMVGLPHNLSGAFEAISVLKNDIVHNGPPTCVISYEGQIIFANDAFEKIADAIADTGLIENAIAPPYSPAEIEAIKQAGGANPDEYTILADGKVKHYLASYHFIDSINNQPGATAVVLRSNDENVQIKDTLAALQSRLTDMSRLVSDWTWETDKNLRITYASPQVQKALGFHPSELLGRNIKDIITEETYLFGDIKIKDLRQPFRDQQLTIKNRIDEERLFLVSGLPFYTNDTGEYAGYRGSARDVTEQQYQQGALRVAKEHAEVANRAKSEFLANMSHELRTPLNAIIGFSEMMSSQLLGPLGNKQYHEYSHDIHASARHLLSVINDILDVAKIEAGKLELLEDTTDPLQLAVSVQRLMIERAENAGLKLKLSLPSKLPMIHADQRKMKQVLINILANAVKFTPSGGIVELSGGINDDGDFEFIVMDTGIGMAEEDIPKAFEPFAQIDSTLSRQFDGTGLGLPLALGLVRLHGGELSMTSKPGKGTTVKCVLPASRILPA